MFPNNKLIPTKVLTTEHEVTHPGIFRHRQGHGEYLKTVLVSLVAITKYPKQGDLETTEIYLS